MFMHWNRMRRRICIAALSLVVFNLGIGCSSGHGERAPHQTPQRAQESRNRLYVDAMRTSLIDQRFVVARMCSTGDKVATLDSIESISWGRSKGADYLDDDLMVVDLESGASRRVFGKPVDIVSWARFMDEGRDWRRSMHSVIESIHESKTLFPHRLIIRTNEGFDSYGRPERSTLFAYHLANGALTELCPAGYSLGKELLRDRRLVLTLFKPGSEGMHVYEVDPVSGEGRFIAEGITP